MIKITSIIATNPFRPRIIALYHSFGADEKTALLWLKWAKGLLGPNDCRLRLEWLEPVMQTSQTILFIVCSLSGGRVATAGLESQLAAPR